MAAVRFRRRNPQVGFTRQLQAGSTRARGGANRHPTSMLYSDARDGEQLQHPDIGPGAVDGGTQILDGSIPASTFDTTAPDLPTGLALSSEVSLQPDGTSLVRLVASLTQPADTDLYASFVQVTSDEDSPGVANWDHPTLLQIGSSQSEAAIDGVAGATLFYARAYSVDVQGNQSAFTAEVTHTTVADTIAPTIPESVEATAGFLSIALAWEAGGAEDLAFYEIRYAIDDGTGTAPLVESYTRIQTKSTVFFVTPLEADVLYWLQVRSVDLSGNVATSATDLTGLNYIEFPDAGWSDLVSATPSLIGETDIAANSVTAVHIKTGSLSADDIGAGTLHIRPLDGFAEGISIEDAAGMVIGSWDEDGIKIIDPLDPSRYLLLDSGELKFTEDDGATFPTAVTPEGINASAINFGSAPGGHNLVLNSSFELADFAAAPSEFEFTDTSDWTAGARVTALDNITEGTALTMTAAGYA